MSASIDILVVDDELPMRMALEASFARAGWRVQTAGGVDEAIALRSAKRFDAIVCDMRMGDGTGLDLLKVVCSGSARIPVLMLTAYAHVSDAVQAMQQGACDYLVKPVSFARLEAALMRAVAANRGAVDSAPVRTLPAGMPLREAERRLLEAALSATGGNRTRAAEMLGISVRTIRNKINAYRLPPREGRP